MTQSEKLQKVIERAVKNGWLEKNAKLLLDEDGDHYREVCVDCGAIAICIDHNHYFNSIEELILNHDFAKAYFGEKLHFQSVSDLAGDHYDCHDDCECAGQLVQPAWQYYLQQLALIPPSERIDYLFNLIENEKNNNDI